MYIIGSMTTERDLIEQSRHGDAEAFTRLIARYEDRIFRLAKHVCVGLSADADDVYQETFLTAWRKLGEVRGGERVLAWFIAIARNLALNERRGHLRERRRRDPNGADLAERLAAPELPAGAEGRLEEAIQHCLSGLSEQVRSVINAHYWEDHDAERIAAAQQRPVSWVRVVLCRARAALAECLRGKGVLRAPV